MTRLLVSGRLYYMRLRMSVTRVCCTDKELFKRSKVEIVGVSSDAVDKQKTFVDKQKLTVRA